MERAIRALAGMLVTVSVILGYYLSPYWFFAYAFCGTEPIPVIHYPLVPGGADYSKARYR